MNEHEKMVEELKDIKMALSKNPTRTITHDFMCGIIDGLVSKYAVAPVKQDEDERPYDPFRDTIAPDHLPPIVQKQDDCHAPNPIESLAELADRKGYGLTKPYKNQFMVWFVGVTIGTGSLEWFNKDYLAAEQAARAYLEALDTKRGRE